MRARPLWRKIVDPKQQDPHVIKPKQIGELFAEIVWNSRFCFTHHPLEQLNTVASNRGRLARERVERTVRIGSRLEQYTGELVIRLERSNLRFDNSVESRLEGCLLSESRAHGRQVLFMQPVVKSLDQMLLGTEVVIRIPERDSGF